LESVNQALRHVEEQKLQREEELQNANRQLNEYRSALAGAKLQDLRARIEEVRAGLANEHEVKTPRHPDIKRMEAALEARYAEAEHEIQSANQGMEEKLRQLQELNLTISQQQARTELSQQLEQ